MEKMRKNHHKHRRFSVFLLLFAVVLCGTLLGGKKEQENAYMIAETGVLTATETFSGLFLYEETVVTANAAGTFSTGFCQGDKISVGESAGELQLLNDIHTDPVKMIASPATGIFSLAVDGWETVLTVEQVDDLDLGAVFLSYEMPKTQITGFCHQGDPCFKVMDNKKNVYLLLALKDVCLTAETVKLSILGEETKAEVVFTKQYGDDHYALLSLPPSDAYFQNREVKADLTLSQEEGVVVLASAVTKRHGETGVYWLDGGDLRFCPVTVLMKEDQNVLVEGIEAGSCILCDAG